MNVETVTRAAWEIRRVKTKLASGEYASEASVCLCTRSPLADVEVATHDRYGIPHRMVWCPCGLIRANPRMIQDAYTAFYQNEYRPIYDGWEFGPHASDAKIFALKACEAENFRQFLEFFDCRPRVVFDVGSGGGELVACLQSAGVACRGIDLAKDESIADLERSGQHADVIVLQQVIEHLLDPLRDVQRLRALLAPGGVLFVGTPGLYATRRELLFQNAHVWQFTTDTLLSLMARAGFEELYLDERIWSLWQATEPHALPPSRSEARYALQYLQTGVRPLPLVKTINKFPLTERKASLRSSLARGLPDISHLIDREAGRQAFIIGAGPSVDSYGSHIRRAQAAGARVITIDRMNLWCLAQGIQPDYCATMDASGDVVAAFKDLDPATVHLVAAQCPPAVFDTLADRQVYIFNTPQRGIDLGDLWHDGDYDRMTILNAGGSVTLGVMSAAMLLGMRDLHVFGFDCHIGAGWYAQGVAGAGTEGSPTVQVRIADRIFTTTYSYLSFAQQFHLLVALGRQLGKLDRVTLYGDSLAIALDATGFVHADQPA